MPKVSVIVPVYNVQKYLNQCVDSLLAQDMTDYEIILVDDGSTDGSGSICDSYQKANDNVVSIHQKNQGVSVARNTGIESAKGKWITFVDSDDWAEPDLLKKAVGKAESFDADILFFSYITDYEDGTGHESRFLDLDTGDISAHKDYIEAKAVTQFYGKTRIKSGVAAGATWGKVIRKEIIDKYELRFPVGVVRAQDTVFWLNAVEHADRIFLTDDYLYHYRLNDSSITRGKKYIRNSEEVFYRLFTEYYKFIETYHKENTAVQDAVYIRTIQAMRWVLEHEIFNKNAGYSFLKKINEFKAFCNNDANKKAIYRAEMTLLSSHSKMMVFLVKRKLYGAYVLAYSMIESYAKRR